jgi:hypothetical protein
MRVMDVPVAGRADPAAPSTQLPFHVIPAELRILKGAETVCLTVPRAATLSCSSAAHPGDDMPEGGNGLA